ncbi:hypothetical protein MG293_005052 [Ovis ammon polii]|uniref:Uncharacterized protein n=1 Tax=Ovis ammon polii TaxID=230172 RepID=A0AAD4UGI8_OVIAM|nr:hypothetical protein MG293_005052 [Ovis ammon polii]
MRVSVGLLSCALVTEQKMPEAPERPPEPGIPRVWQAGPEPIQKSVSHRHSGLEQVFPPGSMRDVLPLKRMAPLGDKCHHAAVRVFSDFQGLLHALQAHSACASPSAGGDILPLQRKEPDAIVYSFTHRASIT